MRESSLETRAKPQRQSFRINNAILQSPLRLSRSTSYCVFLRDPSHSPLRPEPLKTTSFSPQPLGLLSSLCQIARSFAPSSFPRIFYRLWTCITLLSVTSPVVRSVQRLYSISRTNPLLSFLSDINHDLIIIHSLEH